MKNFLIVFLSLIFIYHVAESSQKNNRSTDIITTKIATKTPLIVDYVPGIVTILFGNDMELMGIRNVGDALKQVPGVDISYDNLGIWQTIVRGVSRTFSYGNFKVLLNNIPLNKVFWINPIPDMPIEQVERIEVIRGPGASIYGEFAMSGVINIITRGNGFARGKINRIYTSFGYKNYTGGGVAFLSIPDKEFKIGINISDVQKDCSGLEAGPDIMVSYGLPSNSPGNLNEKMSFKTGIFTLNYKKFFAQAYLMDHAQGDFFGFDYAVPPYNDRSVFQDKQWGIELSQNLNIFSDFNAEFRLGYQQQFLETDSLYLTSINSIFDIYYKEYLLQGGLDLIWNPSEIFSAHTISLGWSFNRTELGDIWLKIYSDQSQPQLTQSLSGKELGLNNGTYRMINSITLQDIFQITKKFCLTSSLRYDHYNDLDEYFTPRLAGVYRLNRKNILKFQYAKAFRPPTFDEIYGKIAPMSGNPDLEPEKIETCELSYIYREGSLNVARCTVFYSDLKNLILLSDDIKKNIDAAYLRGIELEYERQVIPGLLEFYSNISYQDAKSKKTDHNLYESTNILFNTSLVYHPVSHICLALSCRHVGSRYREIYDLRNNLKAYNSMDITASHSKIFKLKGFLFQAGVKNLLDEDILYPSPLSNNNYPTYSEDFPFYPRKWWIKLSYKF